MGAAGSDLLYEEKSELFDVAASRSLDKKVIFLASYAKTSTEVRYLPADTPAAAAKVILPREAGHEYDVDHYNGLFYITTNKGAKNFKVVTAPMNDPAEKNWRVFIEHNPAVRISGLAFFANHIVVSEREGGLTELRVIDPKTRQSHRIATDEPDFALSLGANPEFETTTLRISYQSMVTPPSVYDYDLSTRQRKLLKRQEVLGGYDPSRYEARRLWAVARDGTKVPVSVVHKKGLALDGKAPLLLYGYGSYGASGAPTFSSNRLSLLDRGVIFANAYIRGGGEMGEEWREQGRMMKKINTFADFIDCAEHLVKARYTSIDRLVIQGGSAGGLLVGAAANMRPDLFKAVVAQVPFVDVVNTMLDASLPLTTSEYLEWGNPNEKPAFDYMMQVLALRQHQGGSLPGDARPGVAQRQPGAVLGRHEARREAARHQDRQEPAPPQGQSGCGSRRRVRTLRRTARGRVHLRVHAVADGRAGRGGNDVLRQGSRRSGESRTPQSARPLRKGTGLPVGSAALSCSFTFRSLTLRQRRRHMRACKTAFISGVVLVAGLSILSAQGADPRVGSWHLNVAKSKYSPGPAPKSQMLKIEAAGKGEKVTSETISATGDKTVTEYTAEFDGKPHPLKGSAVADMVTLKRVDSNTTERVDSKGGKTMATYHRVVSTDGKTMTVTIKGTNAQGQAISNVIVFEKH